MSGEGIALGIETSTPAGGVALADVSGRLLLHDWSIARNGYSRRLMPSIDAALRRIDAVMGDLVAIGVTHGPGSFTGVRVGLVSAKTLARALEIPLHLFSTLECLAERAPTGDAAICAVLDARRGEVYDAIYAGGEGKLRPLRPESVETCEALLDAIGSLELESIRFTGDGATVRRREIEARLGDRARFVAPPWNRPGADVVALGAVRRLAEGAPGADPLGATPRYLRRSDAEVNLARRGG